MPFENQPSNLTPTGLAHKLIAELTALGEMLSPAQQRIIKNFCDNILENRSSIADATNLLPLEAALVVIQVKEHENTNHEIAEIHNQLAEIRGILRELLPPTE